MYHYMTLYVYLYVLYALVALVCSDNNRQTQVQVLIIILFDAFNAFVVVFLPFVTGGCGEQ